MRRPVLVAFASTLLSWAAPAVAACPTPYDRGSLLADLDILEQAVSVGDVLAGQGTANDMKERLGCLDEVYPSGMYARIYRWMGAASAASGDVEDAARWLRSSVELEGGFDWTSTSIATDHAVLSLWDQAKAAPVEKAETPAALGPGEHSVDGRSVTSLSARADAWHLYQRKLGSVVEGWVILGATPPRVTSSRSSASASASGRSAGGNRNNVRTEGGGSIQIVRPPHKTPLMIAGGAVMVGGGALYYAAYLSRQKFDAAASPDEVDELRGTTNAMVVSSAVVTAIGAAGLAWGIFVDGGGTPVPGLRVQF